MKWRIHYILNHNFYMCNNEDDSARSLPIVYTYVIRLIFFFILNFTLVFFLFFFNNIRRIDDIQLRNLRKLRLGYISLRLASLRLHSAVTIIVISFTSPRQ